ncbi:MAG: hypothetical protein BWY99_01677 [Synergistetes bacterium ADurb.BinA166]|nr:MAG: hypothetical protein BWY99_01677 [Synergistetes bacterium ADurb.BinA166]
MTDEEKEKLISSALTPIVRRIPYGGGVPLRRNLDYNAYGRKSLLSIPLCDRCKFPLEEQRDGIIPSHREHDPEECLLNEVMGT